jgi:hypothetical protein
METTLATALATLEVEPALADVVEKVFSCCQPAINDSCCGGQIAEVLRLVLGQLLL